MLNWTIPEHAYFRIVAASVLTGVLVVSFLPSDTVDPFRLEMGYSIDISHVLAYALLAFAAILSVPRQALSFLRGVSVVVAISLLGFGIELLQPLVGRTTSIVDFAENEIGVAGGIAIFFGYLYVEKIRARNSNMRPEGR
jgi:VanZ family protein